MRLSVGSLKEICNGQIIAVVSDPNIDAMNGKRPFEERVFARFDAIDARFDSIYTRFDKIDSSVGDLDSRLQVLEVQATDTNSRLQKLEIRAYDTKPIWEQALKEIIEAKREIIETKREIVETRRDLSKRIDRIGALALENRADLRDAEDRIDKIETKLTQ
jgi:chromosome segregation ATPase